MKTVTSRPCFQGDIMIRRIDALPGAVKSAPAEGDRHVLAHSETGHDHICLSRAADKFIDETNEFITYLTVASDTEVQHLRDFDTHESILLTPGIYEVRQQREYVAEGFRRVED